MTYAGYVKVAPGKPQTGWVKLKFSLGTGEAKFSLGEGKKYTESVFIWSVTERCFKVGKKTSQAAVKFLFLGHRCSILKPSKGGHGVALSFVF